MVKNPIKMKFMSFFTYSIMQLLQYFHISFVDWPCGMNSK